MKRCDWAETNEYFFDYHDNEWGKPEHDDRKLFEMLCLEGMQAGVSWLLILKKRENYKRLFHDFHAQKVALLRDDELEEILKDAGVIRNRLKVYSIRNNAQAFLRVKEEFGSFDKYIWGFVNGKPVINNYIRQEEVPSKSDISELMSKDLKKRGFKFVGDVICYSFMQAVGMVDDHTNDCWKHKEREKM